MAASPRTAKDKARKAHARARQADVAYRRVRAQAKREGRRQTQRRRQATKPAPRRPSRHLPARAVGVVGYLVVGVFPYLASGLLAPPGAVVVLMALWAFGLAWTLRIASRSPRWTPLAPILALAVWVALMQAGSVLFGWNA